nr:MAG TPA: hypothetical protein [Caudoviricetes sp.]
MFLLLGRGITRLLVAGSSFPSRCVFIFRDFSL